MSEFLKILKAIWKNEILRPYNDLTQNTFAREEVEKREKVIVFITIIIESGIFIIISSIISHHL